MHRWSQLFIPTLREAPADAEVASHRLLVKAGYIRQLAAGLYSFTFLGQRAMLKIAGIVREEMDKIGQEFHLPALHPREIWEASGRWSVMGDNMFRLKDRRGADLCLGMTHEEIVTDIARKELRSYKQLPQIWYQIQMKFRDEPRPKSGLLRVRQFLMKDAYSFDLNEDGLDVSYKKHYETYRTIFSRCGLKFVVVEAHSGSMGGSQSHEFMVYTDAGEDLIASCGHCGYAANVEKATSQLATAEDLKAEGDGSPLLVHTPGLKTIEEVSKFLGVSPTQKIKTLALMQVDHDEEKREINKRPIVVYIRGDHSMNEAKLTSIIGSGELRPMQAEEIQQYFHAPAGFLGPVGLQNIAKEPGKNHGNPVVVADSALKGRANLVAGANQEDYHLRNVTPEKDFQVTSWGDLRNVSEGEGCPECGSPLKVANAVEIGHIFKLGRKYSESMGARVLDKDGKEAMPTMGCYGIGVERILTSAIEQNNDVNGFWLNRSIAPFDVVVTPTNVSDANLLKTAEDIAATLEQAGFDVLLDDRDERPGVKFKDADLIGIPYRVNVGKKVSEGKVELFQRSTRESQDVTIGAIGDVFAKAVLSNT